MMTTAEASLDRVWEVLDAVPDPEIPVVSIRELGILRDVRPETADAVTVSFDVPETLRDAFRSRPVHHVEDAH